MGEEVIDMRLRDVIRRNAILRRAEGQVRVDVDRPHIRAVRGAVSPTSRSILIYQSPRGHTSHGAISSWSD